MRSNLLRDTTASVLIQIALTATVLLGFVGLVIDLGEAFTLNTELQQAADAAALAAAAELDGFSGAQTRATAAACGTGATCTFGPNRQTFASSGAGKIKLASIAFLSAIDPAEPTLLPPVVAPAGDVTTALDSDAIYVRVQAQSSSITGTLASLVTSKPIFTTTAVATGARVSLLCIQTPMAICNPAGDGKNPFTSNTFVVGDQIRIDAPGGGYLCPISDTNCGGSVFGTFVSSASPAAPSSCVLGTPGLPVAKPGATNGQVKQVDGRFDPKTTFNDTAYPTDGNITTATTTPIVGNGNWGQQAYWNTNHSAVSQAPPSAAGTTRYQMYQWENLNKTNVPTKGNLSAPPATDPRLMNVAIAKTCGDLTSRNSIPVDGLMQTFITQPFGNNGPFYVEYVKPISFSDPTQNLIHNHVQLVR